MEEHLGTRFLLIHAAALANEGLGIILPGPSGAGKSLTAAALTASGFEYFSDEVAVVTDDGRLLPFPKVISLKADGWRKLTEAFPLVAPGCGPGSSESALYHVNPSNQPGRGGRGGGPPRCASSFSLPMAPPCPHWSHCRKPQPSPGWSSSP